VILIQQLEHASPVSIKLKLYKMELVLLQFPPLQTTVPFPLQQWDAFNAIPALLLAIIALTGLVFAYDLLTIYFI